MKTLKSLDCLTHDVLFNNLKRPFNSLFRKVSFDYSKPSKDRRHKVTIENKDYYITNPINNGNSKLVGIGIFDILAIVTCMNNKDKSCFKDCYAKNSQTQYNATWNSRLINSYLAIHKVKLLEEMIINQLNKSIKFKAIRIHSSGEFFNQKYFNMWKRIANNFPHIKFYAYTGSSISTKNLPSNLNIINSVCEDGIRNFGDMDRVNALKSKGYFVCPATIKKNKKCGLHCSYCQSNNKVVFKKH